MDIYIILGGVNTNGTKVGEISAGEASKTIALNTIIPYGSYGLFTIRVTGSGVDSMIMAFCAYTNQYFAIEIGSTLLTYDYGNECTLTISNGSVTITKTNANKKVEVYLQIHNVFNVLM